LKLSYFSVTNYRSITAAHKIKVSDATVLIGKNNEGKSNLLRSLEVAMTILQRHAKYSGLRRALRTSYDEGPYDWNRDFPVQLQNRKSGTQTVFKLNFSLDGNDVNEFKSEIGSSFNGILPLEIRIGKDNEPEIKLIKPGKGTKALSSKSSKISKFVADRIYFSYIPAIRTESESIDLIRRMLSHELRVLESEPAYITALETIAKLQKPILDDLALRVQGPLNEFLPNIKSVKIEIPESYRKVSVRRDFSVVIDDGTPTSIEYKGDGVKSLAALGLLKSHNARGGASILAIEEPESHLHPGAIHQVNEIIRKISETSQVIITTHNPLFVDRSDIKSNIIISEGKATPAKSVGSIRDLLGIKASDNLTHASFALVVEGAGDVLALKSLLPLLSEKITKAIKSNVLVIESIGGAGNLSYKLSLLNNFLCQTHVFLDGDEAGKFAFQKAEKDSLVSVGNFTMINCHGMKHSEFEDCLNLNLYKDEIFNEFGVNLEVSKFKGNKKWSERVEDVFKDQGKPWSNQILSQVKNVVCQSVTKNPKIALNQHRRNSIDALVVALERMIKI
jgi:putative ATP-dependent endonuclease of OLD family